MSVLRRDSVIAVSPLSGIEPSPRLVAAVTMSGGLGVADLSLGGAALRAVREIVRLTSGPIGVRVSSSCTVTMREVDRASKGRAELVILGFDAAWAISETAARYRTLVEVTDRHEALRAVEAGAHGLVIRGAEAGGRVGELSTFVLAQQILADEAVTVPVWVCGGIGARTAAACVIGGAHGVVLEGQLALMPESDLPDDVTAAVRRMDGSETALEGNVRGLRLPGRDDLVAVGQDGGLASEFARRWPDTAAAVRGITTAITDAILEENATELLTDRSPMARALGTRFPVVQGPMTRVSDMPGFAAAVAAGGGLPFVALALSDPDRSRQILHDTARELAGRPWGAGILGFVPDDLRAAQIEAIRQVKPARVIIAGGRPSQASELEADGIPTFLHVPSPGLLRQFLSAGARRFVFEGAECGGHTGPQGSFPLWEAQLMVLDEHLDGSSDGADLEVLFAGGIHDARSAAMVAAMAAGVARRGVRIGILLGTAYLFTEEAVVQGAIQPRFREEALAAERTVLLETAPGHATRCLHTPFADDFHRLRATLTESGVESRQIWQQLEILNVGRLRVASKGLRREDGELLAVDETTQAAEGLYMAGQVAVLRNAATTIDGLHADITTGAAALYQERLQALRTQTRHPSADEAADSPPPEPLDIAIIGMACVFPGSPDLPSYWRAIVDGEDAITVVPADRWDAGTYYRPEVGVADMGRYSISKWGGFIDPVPFDAIGFGIPPAALDSIDPTQLLALEVAHRAMKDAGYPYDGSDVDHSRTGVVFGAEAGSDMGHAQTLRTMLPSYLGEVPPELDEQLPTVTEDTFPGVLANVIAGRVANRFDLGGPNLTVDAACASSLAAMDAACKELLTGDSDLMVCGAADLHNGINDFLMFTSARALSPTGKCRTFDASGDGIALGEGVACLVLKRLADAERDNDKIYAVVKGVGASSDGRALGLTAPRAEGQRRALDRAYQRAGLTPREVGLVEAHGTGTAVGDRTELETLTRLFSDAGAEPGSCALGSVKSQIGHTKCAAGLAGVIKVALSLRHGVRPPTINLSSPSAAWRPDDSPFSFYTEARPWLAPPAKRIAGVSAFGFGGTNYHVVMAGYAQGLESRHIADEWSAELFCFRGADRAAAHRAVTRLASRLAEARTRSARLRDVAAEWARESDVRSGPVRVAVVARTMDELEVLSRRALAGEHDPLTGLVQPSEPMTDGKLAFLFPGQGSQKPGAFADLFVKFPEARRFLQLAPDLAELLCPPTAFGEEEKRALADRVRDTRVAQPLLGICGLTVSHLLGRLGVRPDAAAGHSYGELVALCAGGAYDEETLIGLSRARAEAILAAVDGDPGTMAAVGATPQQVTSILSAGTDAAAPGRFDGVVVANHNSPKQVVIAGPSAAVEDAVAALTGEGMSVRRLQVACAFHSPTVAGGVTRFGSTLAGTEISAPTIPVWGNRTADRYPDDPALIRHEMAEQIGNPVRFAEQVEAMYAHGVRVFVEAGPGQALTGLVRAVLGNRPHVAVACDGGTGGGLRSFLLAVAEMACAGVPVQTGWLFRGRDVRPITGDQPTGHPMWTVDGQLVRDGSGECLPGGMSPPRRIKERRMNGSGGRDELVAEYLRSTREFIASQRDIMLAYLSDDAHPHRAVLPVEGSRPTVPVASVTPVTPRRAEAVLSELPAAELPAAGIAAAGAVPPGERDFRSAVLAVLSERTGYPVDLIGLDSDLEADLSVDSIKRAEVAGEVATRLQLNMAGGDQSDLEDLVRARTVRAMVDWLTERAGEAPRSGDIAPARAASSIAAEDFRSAVLAVLSERTGYPVDLIGLDSDLEADLSVDSIKRAEVAGEVATRLQLNMAGGDQSDLEDLVRARTVRAMVDWLTERAGGGPRAGDVPPAPPAVAAEAAPAAIVAGGARTAPPTRMVARLQPAPGTGAEPRTALSGSLFLVTGESPVAARLVDMLGESGAIARRAVLSDGDLSEADGIILLDGLAEADEPLLPRIFPQLKNALAVRPRWLFAVAAAGGCQGDGLAGLFRTVAREYPEASARLVQVDPYLSPARQAEEIVEELLFAEQIPVIRRQGGDRHAVVLIPEVLAMPSAGGAGPASDGTAETRAIGLDRDSVVVLIGGARGVTASLARALAATTRCRIELAGRSRLLGADESPDTAAATDLAGIRAALARRGMRSPAEIERQAREIAASREIASTLRELRALGSDARYQTLDVRDEEATHRLLKEVHAEHGRIDGLVFSSGVIEDKLLADKDPDSFTRVFATKVDGARWVLNGLEDLPSLPRFVVLYGSIASAFGNRGQGDYAAANDGMDAVAGRWAQRTGVRCLTMHWGPWAAVSEHRGMVTDELNREYARRGIALIDRDEGVLSVLRELAWGDPSVTSVVYTASGW